MGTKDAMFVEIAIMGKVRDGSARGPWITLAGDVAVVRRAFIVMNDVNKMMMDKLFTSFPYI